MRSRGEENERRERTQLMTAVRIRRRRDIYRVAKPSISLSLSFSFVTSSTGITHPGRVSLRDDVCDDVGLPGSSVSSGPCLRLSLLLFAGCWTRQVDGCRLNSKVSFPLLSLVFLYPSCLRVPEPTPRSDLTGPERDRGTHRS